jgi:hypothetical protein
VTKNKNAPQAGEPGSAPLQCQAYPWKNWKKPLTFGDFVASSYRLWGKRNAEGIIRLALKAHLVEFCGQQRFVIS